MAHRTFGISLVSLAAGSLLLSGCATKTYVDEQIAAVNGRISSVEGSLNGQISSLSTRVDGVERTAQAASQRANEAYRLAEGKFLYTVISESDQVTFASGQWKLSKEAQSTLTAFADRLKSENKNVFIELRGHGDPRGSTYSNRILGEKRALEVRRFLTSQGVPLARMSTVSWGEERTKSGAKGAAGYAADRRVVLVVMG